MKISSDFLFEIALTCAKGIGPVKAKQLIKFCGNAEAVFNEKSNVLQRIRHIGPISSKSFRTDLLKKAEKEILFVENNNIKVLYYQDPQYPIRLQSIEDAPVILYYKGTSAYQLDRCISIVGTRTPSKMGVENTKSLVKECKGLNASVISGLAYGIDTIAHQTCVENGIPTIGVLGHGLDRIYPNTNAGLAAQMIENGGLLTEFPSGTKPDRENFPSRNRIIAALSDALVVVESGISGGSMISAEFANNYNKDVFAFPGRVQDVKAKGTNLLIKSHKAALMESIKDICYVMRWDRAENTSARQLQLNLNLNSDERSIFKLLNKQEITHLEELIETCGFSLNLMATTLLTLELKGVAKALPGNRYTLEHN